jgi:dihydrolipoamide dehydrogenase
MHKFDVCVIGAGPSGYAAAMRAIDYGKRVLVIEKNRVGGAGVFNGALSSKTLWELSEKYRASQQNKFGFHVFDSELDFRAVMSEMRQAEMDKYQQLKIQLDALSKMDNLTFVSGTAKPVDNNTVEVERVEGLPEQFKADNIVLAVGSRPRYLPNLPIDEEIVMTSDGIAQLKDFPRSMVIVGAGVIGCEFATIFSNFGRTKVYVIDKQNRILPFEDKDISSEISKNLEANGVTIHHGSQLEDMKIVDGMVEYTIVNDKGKKEVITVEKALVSVGRVPNVENIGLQEVGMKLDKRGYAIDDDTVTSIPNIYAVGDFTADIALVNVAEMEGRFAVDKMYGKTTYDLSYKNISTIMFVNPEVAGVGLNEQQAREEGVAYKMAKVKYKYVNRAIAKRNLNGFFKLLVTDDDEMRILGMRVVGEGASAAIQGVALLISMDKGIRELVSCIHPHPSMTEGILTCARMLLGNSIMKPKVFNRELSCYRVTAEGRISDIDVNEEAKDKDRKNHQLLQ